MIINWLNNLRNSFAFKLGHALGYRKGVDYGWNEGRDYQFKVSNRRGPGKAAK